MNLTGKSGEDKLAVRIVDTPAPMRNLQTEVAPNIRTGFENC